MGRVAELMGEWARKRGASPAELSRWRAAAFLHDALRDAPTEELRRFLGDAAGNLPGAVLHGRAMAARLRAGGVEDEELLHAVAFHTTGHPSLGDLGRALYCADFLDPGRAFRPEWRASLRDRMPGELDQVSREILEAHLHHLLDRGFPILPDTAAFWNRLVGWTGASGREPLSSGRAPDGPPDPAPDGPPGPAGTMAAGE